MNHVAFFCSSEDDSDQFYGNLLGLKKSNSRVISSVLSKEIFGIDIELTMINYVNDHTRFEVFIGDLKRQDVDKIGHICLEVDDREAFIRECETMDLKMNKIPRDDSFILFVSDYDGNLFEIKEKPKQ